MAFASSLFCSSKFLEHTHTLTKRLTVLACSDNTKDVQYVPLPFSIFGSFYPNVRFFFYVKILVGDIEGGAKKKHLNSVPFMGSKELKSYFTYISFCKGDFKGDEALRSEEHTSE